MSHVLRSYYSRCRVDFQDAQTRNSFVNVNVIGELNKLQSKKMVVKEKVMIYDLVPSAGGSSLHPGRVRHPEKQLRWTLQARFPLYHANANRPHSLLWLVLTIVVKYELRIQKNSFAGPYRHYLHFALRIDSTL